MRRKKLFFGAAVALASLVGCDTRPIEEKVADARASQANTVRSVLAAPILACVDNVTKGADLNVLTREGYTPRGSAMRKVSDGRGAFVTLGSQTCTVELTRSNLDFTAVEPEFASLMAQRGFRYIGPNNTRLIYERGSQRVGITVANRGGQVPASKTTVRLLK